MSSAEKSNEDYTSLKLSLPYPEDPQVRKIISDILAHAQGMIEVVIGLTNPDGTQRPDGKQLFVETVVSSKDPAIMHEKDMRRAYEKGRTDEKNFDPLGFPKRELREWDPGRDDYFE